MVTHRTHDIMIFGGMNGMLLQENLLSAKRKENTQPNNRDLNHD